MKGQLIISTPSERQLGPAMRALNERQRLFVVATFEQGKRDATACARAAGYQGDPNTMRVTAHRLSHDPRIIAAMKEEGQRRMDMLGSIAIEKLGAILETSIDEKTQLKAIDMALNRTGFHATSEHINRNETIMSDIEKIERITALAKTLGVEPAKLLGRFAPKEVTDDGNDTSGIAGVAVAGSGGTDTVIDADFEEVGSTEGLEDLL